MRHAGALAFHRDAAAGVGFSLNVNIASLRENPMHVGAAIFFTDYSIGPVELARAME